tara:strand:- start:1112 stop:2308 length:1197 start_codon:yes stop_codon:yes gene_type:complete
LKEFLNRSYLILFSLYCGVISFTDLGEAIPNIILGITILLFPFVVKKTDWKKIQYKAFYILILLVFVIIFQSVLLSRWEDFNFVNKLVLLIIIIILSIPIEKKLLPVFFFLLGSFFLLLLSSIKLFSIFLVLGKIDMTTGDQVASILLGDRPYVGYIYVTSFCLCLYISNSLSKIKFLFYALAFIYFIFILIISARISFISLIIIISSCFFYMKNIIKTSLIILTLCFLGILIFTFNHNLKKRFFISNNNYSLEQLVKFEPRYYIWNCGYNIIIENSDYLIGKGFVKVNNQLKTCYSSRKDFMDKKQQNYFVRRNFNTHNQFLNFFLSTGILSLFLFVLFFVFWFKKDYKNYYVCILIFAIFLFCLVENVLSRQMGVELFALTLIFSNTISNRDNTRM